MKDSMEHETSSAGVKKTSLARGIFYLFIVMVVALALSVVLANYVVDQSHLWRDKPVGFVPEPDPVTILKRVPADELGKYKTRLAKEISLADKKLDANIPRQGYLVINTANNTFRLMKYKDLIREGICSTGSYTILTAGDDQKWVFETPRGMLKVQGKQEAPVWVKPDWAFVEEGLPIPPPGHSSRYEKGVLGDYKLMLGKGYMIHGTIYKRFLGMNVTHGCVRLGDDDLEAVYNNLQIGSRVYIY